MPRNRFSKTLPGGRFAPDMFYARTALAIAAVGLVTLSASTAGEASPGKNKASPLTLVGTTVAPDGRTPVPRVRITVMPESTVTFTDDDGDFFVSWDGRDGWITVISEERARDGGEWCKRVVLHGQPPGVQDPIVDLDLGLIIVMPLAQIGYQQAPILPPSYSRPASLRVPGPKSGEPDTCRMQLSYAADIWGRITRVEVTGGDQPPSGLKDAVFSWIRSVPWTVADETPCDSAEPFRTGEWIDYAWADSAWVLLPEPKRRGRPRPSGVVPQGR
jgi:hypothetical protein